MTDAHLLASRCLSSKEIDVARVSEKSYCCENWILNAAVATVESWAVLTFTAIARGGTRASSGCSATAKATWRGLKLGAPFIDLQLAMNVAS